MNSIINSLCSIDDLRCQLSYYTKGTPKNIADLEEAIEYEIQNKNRVSAIKMLNAKLKSCRKSLPTTEPSI